MPEAQRLRVVSVAALLMVAAMGCGSSRPLRVAALPPRAAVPQITPLQVADRMFDSGDHEAAKDAYAQHLEREGEAADPRARFRLGILLFRSTDTAEARSGVETLRGIAERAEDPYRLAAETLIELETRRARLESELGDAHRQLEALKRIDLERRSRPPDR